MISTSAIIVILISATLTIIGWVGNRLVNILDRMDKNINSIDKTLSQLVIRHDDLEERVEKVERKVYNVQNHV